MNVRSISHQFARQVNRTLSVKRHYAKFGVVDTQITPGRRRPSEQRWMNGCSALENQLPWKDQLGINSDIIYSQRQSSSRPISQQELHPYPQSPLFCLVNVLVVDPSWIVQESTRHQFTRQVYQVNRALFVKNQYAEFVMRVVDTQIIPGRWRPSD